MSSLDAETVERLWPRLPDFRRLAAAADPQRTFASAFGERVLRT